eukprot:3864632-Amphidinium_carterae.1
MQALQEMYPDGYGRLNSESEIAPMLTERQAKWHLTNSNNRYTTHKGKCVPERNFEKYLEV